MARREIGMLIWRRPPLLSGAFDDPQAALEADWQPDLDVFEVAHEFVLCLSLPGVRRRDVDITVVGRVMVVSGVRRPVIPDGAIAHLIEAPRGTFARRIRLPADSRVTGIRTQKADGQLLFRVPKIAPRAMKISVRTGR
jgi:HSP20 family protein